MKTLRCSSLPIFMSCAPSLEGDLRISEDNEAARLGSAVHKAMESVVIDIPVEVEAIAQRFNVSEKDLGPLVWYGRKCWESLAQSMPDPRVEIQGSFDDESFRLIGHVDVRSRTAPDAVVHADWKSGRVDSSYYYQLMGYALCEFEDADIQTVTGSVVWLREQEIESYVFRRADIAEYVATIIAQLWRKNQFTIGSHCTHCPRSHSCPALKAQASRDIAVLGGLNHADLSALGSAEIGRLFAMSKTVVAVAESYQDAVRRLAANGPIDCGDGTEIRLVPEKGHRVIDTAKAWPVLQERMDDDEMSAVLSVRASKADEVVAAKAGKGKGAAARRELAAALEAVGAVTQGQSEKLKVVRKQKEIEG